MIARATNAAAFFRRWPRKPRSHERGYSKAGFSLFEVVIAMSILSLLAGTVFSIVWKAADSAAEIREYDARDEQISRFLAMMRRTIESMPQGGKISMAPPDETGSEFYEMVITDSATAFHFGELPSPTGETIIGMRPLPDDVELGNLSDVEESLFQVAISREDFGIDDADGDGMVFQAGEEDAFLQVDEEGRYWMPILDFVTGMSWRFWDEEQRDWLDLWEDDSRMPQMLELSLDDPYRPAPIRIVFDLPDHLTVAENQSSSGSSSSAESSSSEATSSTTAAQSRPGSGDGQRPPGGDRADRPGGGKGGEKGARRGGGEGGRGSRGRGGGDRGGGGSPDSVGGRPPGNPGGGSGGGRPSGGGGSASAPSK